MTTNIKELLDVELTPDRGSSSLPWSSFQETIFSALNASRDNLLIEAVAGSGKTSTIVEATLRVGGSSLFLAFNKAISEDIKAKGANGDVKTLNALGHGLWMGMRKGAKLDADKVRKILRGFMPRDVIGEYLSPTARLVSLAKNLGLPIHGYIALDLEEIILDFDLDIPPEMISQVCAWADQGLKASLKDQKTFDFDDQLLVPVMEGWEFPAYSNIFVDECQDLNLIQHLMLKALSTRGARIVAVGDRAQAIYGFRGALGDSMDQLKIQFGMKELPLSISYRCAKGIVEEAQTISSSILWRPNAPEGAVIKLRSEDSDPRDFGDCLVICRNNAPLFKSILWYVREKKPCRVLSSFLTSFQGFIKSFKCETSEELLGDLEIWYEKEVSEAHARGARGRLALLADKRETLKLLCAEFSQVSDILGMLRRLEASRSGTTFSTIHKAKGLESERVFILRPDLVPSRFAETPEQQRQEMNLLYVAITRAKNSLTFGVSPWGVRT